MKKSIILVGLILIGAFLLPTSVSAQEEKKQEKVCCDKQENDSCEESKDVKTASFKVYGSCGMCKNRIEKAATSVKGACSAEWDKETKLLKLTYHSEKVKVEKIHDAITLVGYDTEKSTASDQAYTDLPGCCKYDRK